MKVTQELKDWFDGVARHLSHPLPEGALEVEGEEKPETTEEKPEEEPEESTTSSTTYPTQ